MKKCIGPGLIDRDNRDVRALIPTLEKRIGALGPSCAKARTL